MELLERESQLQALRAGLREVVDGGGRTLLIGGEAGVGKSSLVETFTARTGGDVRVFWGNCDALRTPRVLGAVRDIAAMLPALQTLSGEPGRERLFTGLLDELCRRPVTIVVLEDLHWADEATLDFVSYLGRRIQRTRCLFIATFRDDELPPMHPLRRTLGDLTGDHVARMSLPRLSADAIAELAGDSGRDAARIFAITAGNPFFVRELLAANVDAVPETVRDAVLARLARCGGAARAVAELVSLMPGRTELWLLESLLGETAGTAEAVECGLIQQQVDAVAFRHELARLAVESALPAVRARDLHRRVLRALRERKADLSRLVHHAERAGDAAAILAYAPLAAKQAAELGAHREAAAHYAVAIGNAEDLPPPELAVLLEHHAWECYVTNQVERTMASANRALALWRRVGDARGEARALLVLARQYWKLVDKAAADRHVAEAIALLERHPESPELGKAYSARSQLDMLEGRVDSAIDYGRRAIELARQFEDSETESHALNNVGAAMVSAGDDGGYTSLERSLAIASERGLDEHAGRAYSNLATCSLARRDFGRAARYLDEGIAYCEEHENDTNLTYLRAYLARFELERGRWTEAAELASKLLRNADLNPVQRIPTLVVLALVRVRRGDPGSEPLLDEASRLADRTRELQRVARVAAARAELAWYRDDAENGRRHLSKALQLARGHRDSWIKGELLFWKSRFDPPGPLPGDIAEPYRFMIEGRWEAAARSWEAIGMPYEQAVALSLGPVQALRDCLDLLQALGAGPLAAMVRRRLRRHGERGVRRGPRATTRNNPAGLTDREVEVLGLLVHGHSNAELAKRLHLSVKTVGHHVSAILAKLEVRTRTEAAATALRLGFAAERDPRRAPKP